MKKKFLLVLIVVVLGLFIIKPTLTYSSSLIENANQEKRTYQIFNLKLEQVKGESNLTIDKVKKAYDFAGNTYQIIECLPIGYMIYSVETGVFVEYSISSFSPYYNYYDNLYYGGPTYYYYFSNNTLYHTIINEKHSNLDMIGFSNSSREFHDELTKKKDEAVLEYIKEGKEINNITPEATWERSVYYPSFFKNLDPFGDMDGDNCGFIALNMMIAYHDKYKNKTDEDIMDDKYWYNPEKTALKSFEDSLSQYLYDLDPKDGTTSVHIHNVMKKYSEERNLSYDHTSRYKPFYTIETVMNAIDRNTPVEAFGNLGNPLGSGSVSHAVVIYKYRSKINFLGIAYDADYTCHFGWYGYNEVVLTGTIGSIYFFE